MKNNKRHNGALLSVKNLVVEFRIGRRLKLHAVSDVSLDITAGETLGLVGESGCGKSTLARSLVRLQKPTAGMVHYNGMDLSQLSDRELRRIRPEIQMIFQDASASLNPGRKIAKTIAEPLRVMGKDDPPGRVRKVRAIMKAVGLDPDRMSGQYPFELSGGQCQRVSIARALILRPKLLICDEPVSSLDVSIQAQILNLLEDMKRQFNLTMLFISHDLAVVKNISDRVAVMYLGKLCEIAPAEDLYRTPRHPYSRAMLDAIPDPDAAAARAGIVNPEIPSPAAPPPGCRFHTRCPRMQTICRQREPVPQKLPLNRQVACHFPLGGPDG